MSRLLTEEQASIVKTIHDFLNKELKPNLRELDRDGTFPDDIYRRSFELGLNSFEIPEAFGGLGLDYSTAAAIYEEMGYFDAGIALTMCTTNLALKPVLIAGNDAQKKLFCDRILEKGYASFALTEPGGGSDVASTRTKAVRDGDDYVINGAKCFITNGAYAGVYVVVASTEPGAGAKGLTASGRASLSARRRTSAASAQPIPWRSYLRTSAFPRTTASAPRARASRSR